MPSEGNENAALSLQTPHGTRQTANVPRFQQDIAWQLRKRSVINRIYRIRGVLSLKRHMNGSDKRRWFRVAPRGLVPGSANFCSGPRPCRSNVMSSIYRPAAPASNCRDPTTCPSGSNFFTATREDSAPLPGRRGFRIGISYEGTIQRSSVSGGLSRPKSGTSLLSRDR